MCLSIICLGAGLAQAAREPTNAFLIRQAVAPSPRIPISVFADEEAQPDEVAQAEQGDAVVPPVKRQRPVTPPDTPSAIPAPQAPPAPTPPQEATPAAGTAQEQPEPPRPESATHNAEDTEPAVAPAAAEKESVQAPHEPDASGPIFPEMGGIFAPITDWLASANRDYQNTVVKELSRPSDGAAQEQADQAAKEAKDAQAAKEARQAQAAREREAAVKAQAAARAEAEVARRAQQAAQSQAQKPAEDSADQAAARARQAEEQRQAEAARRAEQARKDEEDRKARDEADARKLREAARVAEERRKQLAEEETRKAEAARAARLAAQERRAAAEAEQSAARAVAPNQTDDQAEPDGRSPALKHRRWAVIITPEPIGQSYAEPAADVLIANQRLAPRMSLGAESLRGTRVKGWSWHPGRCRFAGRRVKRLPGRYIVAKGDSLWRISQKHYDTGRLYTRIYRANRHKIADPDLIYPCQKFRVPRR